MWACVCWSLGEVAEPLATPFAAFWVVSGATDLTILILNGRKGLYRNTWATLHVLTLASRFTLTCAAVVCALAQRSKSPIPNTDEETRSLLNGEQPVPHYGNGTDANLFTSSHAEESGDEDESDADSDEDEKEIKELQKKRMQEQGGWFGYLSGFLVFLPHLLPYKDRFTQYWLLGIIGCVAVERVLTVMIPRQLGAITEVLGREGMNGQ